MRSDKKDMQGIFYLVLIYQFIIINGTVTVKRGMRYPSEKMFYHVKDSFTNPIQREEFCIQMSAYCVHNCSECVCPNDQVFFSYQHGCLDYHKITALLNSSDCMYPTVTSKNTVLVAPNPFYNCRNLISPSPRFTNCNVNTSRSIDILSGMQQYERNSFRFKGYSCLKCKSFLCDHMSYLKGKLLHLDILCRNDKNEVLKSCFIFTIGGKLVVSVTPTKTSATSHSSSTTHHVETSTTKQPTSTTNKKSTTKLIPKTKMESTKAFTPTTTTENNSTVLMKKEKEEPELSRSIGIGVAICIIIIASVGVLIFLYRRKVLKVHDKTGEDFYHDDENQYDTIVKIQNGNGSRCLNKDIEESNVYYRASNAGLDLSKEQNNPAYSMDDEEEEIIYAESYLPAEKQNKDDITTQPEYTYIDPNLATKNTRVSDCEHYEAYKQFSCNESPYNYLNETLNQLPT